MKSAVVLFAVLLFVACAESQRIIDFSKIQASVNQLRASAPGANLTALTWSSDLTTKAAAWAAKCDLNADAKDRWFHSEVFALLDSTTTLTEDQIVQATWGGEKRFLDGWDPSWLPDAKNYTALVWQQSTQIGCAQATCSNFGQQLLIACYVNPRGRFPGLLPYTRADAPDPEQSVSPWSNSEEFFEAADFEDEEGELAAREVQAPTSFDWRNVAGRVTAVKNQGQCGSCWDFAATAAAETRRAKNTGVLRSLSVQQVLDCSGGGSCSGGQSDLAAKYIVNAGLVLNSLYPYKTAKGTCRIPTGTRHKINGYAWGTSKSEGTMVNYVYDSPIVIYMDVQKAFYYYSSGIFHSTACSSTGGVNHAMVILGYGSSNGVPFWTVRNSWGTGWGLSGYARVRRGTNTCSIAHYPLTFR